MILLLETNKETTFNKKKLKQQKEDNLNETKVQNKINFSLSSCLTKLKTK